MKVTLVNKSAFPTSQLQEIVQWLSECFGEISMPVRLTVRSKRGWGSWGKAFFPQPRDRRPIKVGEYAITLYVGTLPRATYPFRREYKKRAGPYYAESLVDEVVHTMAHEFRHVEQYDAFKRLRNFVMVETASFGRAFRAWEHSRHSGFPYGSCEVDAELLAHGLFLAYKDVHTSTVVQRRSGT